MIKRAKVKRQRISKKRSRKIGLFKFGKGSTRSESKYIAKKSSRDKPKNAAQNYKKSKKKLKNRNNKIKSILQLRVFKISFVFLILVFFVTTIGIYIGKDKFLIDSVSIKGVKYIEPSFVEEVKSEYLGKVFFFVFPKTVSNNLRAKNGYIKDVSVTKTLPRSLSIEVEEREPFFALINRKGVYVVSRDGAVLENLKSFESPTLTKEEINYISDNINLESIKLEGELEATLERNIKILDDNRIIQEELDRQLESEPDKLMIVNQKPLTDEEVLELEQGIEELKNQIRHAKLEIINTRKKEIFSKMDTFWKSITDDLKIENFVKIYSYNDNNIEISTQVEENIDTTFEVATELSKILYLGTLDKIIFISELQVKLIFSTGKVIVIDPMNLNDNKKLTTDISLVIDDLVKKTEEFSIIDARGDKISVKK